MAAKKKKSAAKKRGPGRPKGSKNKKSYEMGSFEMIPSSHPSQKRRRGRPAKTAGTGGLYSTIPASHPSQRKRRGRPPGSKNKAKPSVNAVLSAIGTRGGKQRIRLEGEITPA